MQRGPANPTASSREVVINEPARPAIRNPATFLCVVFEPRETLLLSGRRWSVIGGTARAKQHQQNPATRWRPPPGGFHSIQPPWAAWCTPLHKARRSHVATHARTAEWWIIGPAEYIAKQGILSLSGTGDGTALAARDKARRPFTCFLPPLPPPFRGLPTFFCAHEKAAGGSRTRIFLDRLHYCGRRQPRSASSRVKIHTTS